MSAPPYSVDKIVPAADKCGSVIQFIVLANNSATFLVGPSYKRRGLILVPDINTTVYVSNVKPTANAQGFGLSANGGPLELCLYRHGDVVQKPWWAWGTIANATIGIIEVMEP